MKSAGKWIAGGAAVAIGVLLWPGPTASATPSLGGYEAVASATVVHVEVYDPTIPIPSSPQADLSVGYSKSNVESGPTTRALASYLWPGVVLGDGFDQLIGVPGVKYPVQANSRYPATADAPAKNTIQLTDGNGMTTSSDGPTTRATVTGLGLAGPNTDLLGGIGTGLNELGGKSSTPTAAKAPKALPISSALATLVTAQHVTSSSTVTVADTSVTSTAHAAASNISLLGGLISVKGVDVESQIVSDATKATLTGGATIGAVTIAGNKIALDDKGVNIAGTGAALPTIPATLTGLLKTLGIEVTTLPVTKTSTGPQGELGAKVLVVTVDTAPLKTALNGPLAAVLKLLGPNAEQQLAPLISLGPKLVLTIGDAESTASASPGFDAGGGGAVNGGGSGATGGGSGATGGGDTSGGGSGTGDTGTTGGGSGATGGSGGTGPVSLQPAAMNLPGLGAVPRAMILGALAFAGIVGWGLRRAGGFLLGGERSCAFGLRTGVPDLRKG